MKKFLFALLSIILLLTFVVGCTKGNAQLVNKTNLEYTTEGKNNILIYDESLFGELNIDFMGTQLPQTVERVTRLFNQYYPNVKLNIQNEMSVDFEEKYAKLQTQIMSGKGPDIFSIGGETIDPYKMMMSGATVDMAPYFEGDKNFNIDEYNKAVIYSGQINGKQYYIPMRYNFNILITTQSIINETGFDVSKCTDYFSMSDEVARIVKQNKLGIPQDELLVGFGIPRDCINQLGITWIDYENKKTNIDTPEIKMAFESYKNDFLPYIKSYGADSEYFYNNIAAKELHDKKMLFYFTEFDCLNDIIINSRALESLNEEIVIIPWRNLNGGIQATSYNSIAVNQNCENVQAAYYFIKCMLNADNLIQDDDIGNLKLNGVIQLPLMKSSIEKMLKAQTSEMNIQYSNDIYSLRNPLNERIIEQFLQYLDEVDEITLEPPIKYEILEIMEPYLTGEKSYEECIQSAQSKLEIYISE